MPKLTIHSDADKPRRTSDTAFSAPRPKPCPRCRVMLTAEKTYTAKGLTGLSSTEHRFTCPACDARFHYSERTGRWRELAEEPV